MPSSSIGGYPVQFLRCVIKMNKILNIKRDMLNKIKEINSRLEFKVYQVFLNLVSY